MFMTDITAKKQAARARAVAAFLNEIGMVDDSDPATAVWHVLYSLIEFCDDASPRIDIDEQLRVRAPR